MSAPTPATPPAPPAAASQELTVVSHSSLFYWWPVWAIGFLMGILTLTEKHSPRMVVVPSDSVVHFKAKPAGREKDPDEVIAVLPGTAKVHHGAGGRVVEENGEILEFELKDKDKNKPPRDVVLLPADSLEQKKTEQPKLHMTKSKNYGVLFATVLVLVIIITNVPLRGGWSFAIIVFTILLIIIFALADWWDTILDKLHYLDIRINAGGYFFISGILCGIWLIVVLVFDPRIYMTFSPGQFKVCTEIGGGEKVFPAEGMALEKQRSDLFRHWILGLGSGDLIVKTTGAKAEHFDLHNVLFIGKKVKQIEEMMKRKVVIASR